MVLTASFTLGFVKRIKSICSVEFLLWLYIKCDFKFYFQMQNVTMLQLLNFNSHICSVFCLFVLEMVGSKEHSKRVCPAVLLDC